MWSMWDAPSDRDYNDQFNPYPEEEEETEESMSNEDGACYETFAAADEPEPDAILSRAVLFNSAAMRQIEDENEAWHCEFGVCPTFTALVDRMDTACTVRELVEIGQQLREHDVSACSYREAAKEGTAPELVVYAGAACTSCGSERKAVITERLLAHRPETVCCEGHVA